MSAPLSPRPDAPVLITGGAGFIGTNLAARLLAAGQRVRVYDNLSRPGVERNLAWLRQQFGEAVAVEIADLRDAARLREAVAGAAAVYHFAAQVAVTTSLEDPHSDFEINLRGTFDLLQALRTQRRPPPLVFTSTNKVYGALSDVPMQASGTRHQPADAALRAHGLSEAHALDFHSPYGCSKGGADQYVLDHARSFGLPATVLRMSCIYGPHQCGTEDQGWVAHFLLRALDGEAITLYGDGRQVRDVLFVEDLVDALLLARERIRELSGRAFNIGGGPANTTSLLELLERIATLTGRRPATRHAPARTGDQPWYVSDTRAFGAATGWTPTVGVEQGLSRLHAWLQSARSSREQARTRTHAA